MKLFNDEIIEEFIEWKTSNPNNFTWWNYVNMKADLPTALGFVKFFYPEVIEIEGCFLLKDNFSSRRFRAWKKDCNNKSCIEKMMNLYEVKDFFHINTNYDGNADEQILALGNALKLFWTLSFKERYPQKNIIVDIFAEEDTLFITVYERI